MSALFRPLWGRAFGWLSILQTMATRAAAAGSVTGTPSNGYVAPATVLVSPEPVPGVLGSELDDDPPPQAASTEVTTSAPAIRFTVRLCIMGYISFKIATRSDTRGRDTTRLETL